MQSPKRKRLAQQPVHTRGNSLPYVEVTICTKDRMKILATETFHQTFLQVAERSNDYSIPAYVIMPDHIHLVLMAKHHDPILPTKWSTWLKQELTKNWNNHPPLKKLWQSRCFDRQLRSDESLAQKIDYLRMNPVRANLVTSSEMWPYQGEIHPILQVESP